MNTTLTPIIDTPDTDTLLDRLHHSSLAVTQTYVETIEAQEAAA